MPLLLSFLPPACLPACLSPLLPACSASKFYLDNRGRTEYALDAVLARVEEEHEGQGDGSFVQVGAALPWLAVSW